METDIIKIVDNLLMERAKARVVPPCVPFLTFFNIVYKIVEDNYHIRRGINGEGLIFKY